MTTWHAEWAWLGGEHAVADVLLVEHDGVFVDVRSGVPAPPGSERLPGLAMPALVNAHSHAFHRALRAVGAGGDFWSWREHMYRLADRLRPDTYESLARGCFGEMALAGIGTVYEFHYLHETGMDDAVVEAARVAGVRLVLLDVCYLRAGFDGGELAPAQRRFCDPDVGAWAARAAAVADRHPDIVVGAAIHSVRAVDPASMAEVATWAEARRAPLHVHVSEQPAENEACIAATGRTPTALLSDVGALGPRTTVVHATHVQDDDIRRLGRSGTTVCICPTTERDLADGVGPAGSLADTGCPLTLGSDSHAVIDLFEEARAVELDERLVTGRRGLHAPTSLLTAAVGGNRLAPGQPADITVLSLDSVRLAGFTPEAAARHVVFSATAADVTHLIVGGRRVVAAGKHLYGDPAADLRRALAGVWA